MRTLALGRGKKLGHHPKDSYMFTLFKTPLTGNGDENAYLAHCASLLEIESPRSRQALLHGKTYYVLPQHAPSAKAAKHLKEDVAKETILSFEGPGRRGA